MSLASLLAKNNLDSSLNDIFETSAGAIGSYGTSSGPSTQAAPTKPASKKRKRVDELKKTEEVEEEKQKKSVGKKERKGEDKKAKLASSPPKIKNAKATEESSEPEHDEKGHESASSSDESEGRDPVPVHESLQKSSRKKKASSTKKTKYVPADETRERRDARTIFVGNLPVDIVKSKSLTKQLKRHILSHVPTASIESIRFRSVAFQNPTIPLPDDADDSASKKEKRQLKRAAEWREQGKGQRGGTKEDEEEAENRKGEKTYLTSAQKRRLAAIKGEVHSHAAASLNAYIVFAHPLPHDTESHVPRKVAMDPHEAAREAVKKCDGTLFAEHTIRVDLVGKSKEAIGLPLTNSKLSVFVGNLDFATTDDDLRAFFEGILTEELGKPEKSPTDAEVGEDESNLEETVTIENPLRKPTWITRVRVVRDRDTQLGKGIAYVQFSDRNCVDEVMAMDQEKLNFAKRTLRVQRCKANAAIASKVKASQQLAPKAKHSTTPFSRPLNKPRTVPIAIPKGDPSLGTRLADLSKEQRKEAKASDPTRQARRLAKKKARANLAKAGVKESRPVKERVRERKVEKGVVNTGRKEGRKRIRSDRNVEKRNAKK